MENGRCGRANPKLNSPCHSVHESKKIQPFPCDGPLKENLGLPLHDLEKRIHLPLGRAYSYVLSTVKLDNSKSKFEQHGSAPNFQGGILSLCTCKHQMRSTQTADAWVGIWLVGFSSRTLYCGRHWLFYLARIARAYESHADLWQALEPPVGNSKAADKHFLGDIFRPNSPQLFGNARFSPDRYFVPSAHAHRQHKGDRGWRNDINYRHAAKYRHPPLLVADPTLTFIWDRPLISLTETHSRNFQKWPSLSDLLSLFQESK